MVNACNTVCYIIVTRPFPLPAHGNPDGILIVLFVDYSALIINDLELSEST